MLASALDGGSSSGTEGWAELCKAHVPPTSHHPIPPDGSELGWASAKSTSGPRPHPLSITASESILTNAFTLQTSTDTALGLAVC